jgi:hypothetical protein
VLIGDLCATGRQSLHHATIRGCAYDILEREKGIRTLEVNLGKSEDGVGTAREIQPFQQPTITDAHARSHSSITGKWLEKWLIWTAATAIDAD